MGGDAVARESRRKGVDSGWIDGPGQTDNRVISRFAKKARLRGKAGVGGFENALILVPVVVGVSHGEQQVVAELLIHTHQILAPAACAVGRRCVVRRPCSVGKRIEQVQQCGSVRVDLTGRDGVFGEIAACRVFNGTRENAFPLGGGQSLRDKRALRGCCITHQLRSLAAVPAFGYKEERFVAGRVVVIGNKDGPAERKSEYVLVKRRLLIIEKVAGVEIVVAYDLV